MFETVPPIMLALKADKKTVRTFPCNSESSTYDQNWMHNNYCVLQKDYCCSSATVVPERLWSRPKWSWNQRPCSAVNHQVGILGELKSSTSLMVEIQIEEQEKEQEALDKLDNNIATISSLTVNGNLLPYTMNPSYMTWKMIMTTWSYMQDWEVVIYYSCSHRMKKLLGAHTSHSASRSTVDNKGVKLPKLEVPTFDRDGKHSGSSLQSLSMIVPVYLYNAEKLVHLQQSIKNGVQLRDSLVPETIMMKPSPVWNLTTTDHVSSIGPTSTRLWMLNQSLHLPRTHQSIRVSGSFRKSPIASFQVFAIHCQGRKQSLWFPEWLVTCPFLQYLSTWRGTTSLTFPLLIPPLDGTYRHSAQSWCFCRCFAWMPHTRPSGSPVALETEFGWWKHQTGQFSGPSQSTSNNLPCLSNFRWREVLGDWGILEESLNHFEANHHRTKEGRLPKKPDARPIGESRSQAVRIWNVLWIPRVDFKTSALWCRNTLNLERTWRRIHLRYSTCPCMLFTRVQQRSRWYSMLQLNQLLASFSMIHTLFHSPTPHRCAPAISISSHCTHCQCQ